MQKAVHKRNMGKLRLNTCSIYHTFLNYSFFSMVALLRLIMCAFFKDTLCRVPYATPIIYHEYLKLVFWVTIAEYVQTRCSEL